MAFQEPLSGLVTLSGGGHDRGRIVGDTIGFPTGERLGTVSYAEEPSAAICVEAAELLEQFQWARDAEVAELVIRERESIENEIADIAIFLTYLCADLNVSLPDIVRRKVDLNRK